MKPGWPKLGVGRHFHRCKSHDRASVLAHIGALARAGGLRRVNDRRAEREKVLKPLARFLELVSGFFVVFLARLELCDTPAKLKNFRKQLIAGHLTVIHEDCPTIIAKIIAEWSGMQFK